MLKAEPFPRAFCFKPSLLRKLSRTFTHLGNEGVGHLGLKALVARPVGGPAAGLAVGLAPGMVIGLLACGWAGGWCGIWTADQAGARAGGLTRGCGRVVILNISTPTEQHHIHQPSVRVSRATAHGWFVEHTDPQHGGQPRRQSHLRQRARFQQKTQKQTHKQNSTEQN